MAEKPKRTRKERERAAERRQLARELEENRRNQGYYDMRGKGVFEAFRNRPLAGLATVATIAGLAALIYKEGPQIASSNNRPSLVGRIIEYNGPGEIPDPTSSEPYRAITASDADKLTVKFRGQEVVRVPNSVGSIADYIYFATNGKISKEVASNLIEAENSQYQLDLGIPKDKVDPTLVADGHSYPLPKAFGDEVGELVKPVVQ